MDDETALALTARAVFCSSFRCVGNSSVCPEQRGHVLRAEPSRTCRTVPDNP